MITHRTSERISAVRFEGDVASGFSSSLVEKYMQRPLDHPTFDFTRMTLLEYAMLFKLQAKRRHDQDEDEDLEDYFDAIDSDENILPKTLKYITLQNNQRMAIRNVPAAVRTYTFNVSYDPEGYYYSLMMQYIPFRNEDELMKGYETAREQENHF